MEPERNEGGNRDYVEANKRRHSVLLEPECNEAGREGGKEGGKEGGRAQRGQYPYLSETYSSDILEDGERETGKEGQTTREREREEEIERECTKRPEANSY